MAINNITLGEDQPLSNDLKPIKVGGEASILEISSPLPDGSDNGQIKVNGDLDITGTLKTKLSHDLIYDFDDEVNTLAQAKVDALIDSAPAALDTLNELAAALNDDASFSTTVTNSLALKAPLAAPAFTGNATFAGVTDFNDRVDINETAFPQLTFSDDGGTDKMNMGQSGEIFYFKTSDTANDIRFRRSDNEDLLNLDMSALRVGIGTTSPDVALEINGGAGTDLDPLLRINKDVDADGSATGILIGAVANGQSKSGIFFENKGLGNGRGNLYFCNDNTADSSDATIADARMTIVNDGNVGIGTTSPNAKLEVVAGADDGILVNRNATTTDSPVEVGFRHTTSDGGATTGMRSYRTNEDDSNDQELRFFTTAGSGGQGEHLTIKHDGKIGIGTDSPTTTLDVDGTVSYKHTAFSTLGPTDDLDVSDTTIIECNTVSNSITIGGFTGGVQGQVIHIVKTSSSNNLSLEHAEGTGNQDIYLTTGANERIVGYGGWALYCNGSNWFSLSNPTGGVDA